MYNKGGFRLGGYVLVVKFSGGGGGGGGGGEGGGRVFVRGILSYTLSISPEASSTMLALYVLVSGFTHNEQR